MIPPNFQPHSEGLPASPGIPSALHLGLTCQDPPNPLPHQCHQFQERRTGKPKGSTHPGLTTPKGHRQRAHTFGRAGKASIPQPPRAYPWMQDSPSLAGQCQCKCLWCQECLPLAGWLSFPPGPWSSPTWGIQGTHPISSWNSHKQALLWDLHPGRGLRWGASLQPPWPP